VTRSSALPFHGTDEHVVRANAWIAIHYLTCGVHGLVLCHAETAGAVKALIEAIGFPFNSIGVGQGLDQGRRGNVGGAGPVWGLEHKEYLRKADVWPLNPEGELMVGLKIENYRAVEDAEASCRVPGVTYAEWGPGDMAYSSRVAPARRDNGRRNRSNHCRGVDLTSWRRYL
jgi:4-hydroxy-2-oxoheptanedioate aldolase